MCVRRVLVIAGRVGSDAWSSGDVVARVVSGLVERGYGVGVIAESVDDSDRMRVSGAGLVVAKNRFEQSASDFPFGFGGWARQQRRKIEHDVSVSFSRVVGGNVWMPLDPTGWSWLGQLVSARGVARSMPTVAKHWGVVRELASIARAGSESGCVLAVGEVAAQGARRRVRGAEVREVEFFSPVQVEHNAGESATPMRVRRLIGAWSGREVRPTQGTAGFHEHVVIGVNASGRAGPALMGLFQEVALAHGPMSPIAGPLGVVFTREQFRVREMACRAGAERFVRVVGMTGAIEQVLGECDAAALPTACAGGAFDSGAMGRMAATALVLGKPLIAMAGAPGAELCSRRVDGQEAGVVVDGSFGSWRRALRMIADEGWRTRASAAAAEIGRELKMDRLVGEIVDAIGG